MKECFYRIITGKLLNSNQCKRKLTLGGCETCECSVEELPKKISNHEKDELPIIDGDEKHR